VASHSHFIGYMGRPVCALENYLPANAKGKRLFTAIGFVYVTSVQLFWMLLELIVGIGIGYIPCELIYSFVHLACTYLRKTWIISVRIWFLKDGVEN
jgi:hypothetical protein